jgi:hypothetical protein
MSEPEPTPRDPELERRCHVVIRQAALHHRRAKHARKGSNERKRQLAEFDVVIARAARLAQRAGVTQEEFVDWCRDVAGLDRLNPI